MGDLGNYETGKSYSAQSLGSAPRETPPALQQMKDRFEQLNKNYISSLIEIEERLHNILNLRSPEKEPNSISEKVVPSDFNGTINEHLDFFEQNNFRLQRIHDHIKKIIG